ncbi:60S ribosomal protein L12 [Tritrichomonas foetus]|uniref:60S ribosomal protein L12 n=1 Tax=Tritrichomonas foetus TaxID=1144522 RepID=A0A1J4JBN2_9EUKA|nr:60S ribosomal protein L12 [Tritrichomonas foetus]|eukprot:OHS96590.1 60S ribosomal protein L12 [Tritrichomonas foetus]
MSQEVIIRARVWGGESGVTAKLAPRLGPLGVNSGQVGQQVAKATEEYKGYRCTVQITIVDRQATISIVPSTSTLLIHALQEPHRDRKKTKNVKHSGNLTLDTIIDIARQMRHKSMSKTLAGTVKEVLGTAQAMGARVEGQDPKDVQEKITGGELQIPNE